MAPFRITIATAEVGPGVETDAEEGLDSVLGVDQEVEDSAQLPQTSSFQLPRPSVRPQTPNDTNGLCGTSAPARLAEIVKTEIDNDDFIMLEASPTPQAKADRPAPREGHPLTPPLTPYMESPARLPSSSRVSVAATSTGPRSEIELGDDDDFAPQHSSRILYRHDPLSVDGPPPAITKPEDRARMMQTMVQQKYRRPFEQLEQAFHGWEEQNFRGTLKAFFERTKVEVRRWYSVLMPLSSQADFRSWVPTGPGQASSAITVDNSSRWYRDCTTKGLRCRGDPRSSIISSRTR